ncbi:MAG: hypothetical protein HY006_04550 [Candidatus Sungbacteria bacterium]|nr:hypothetical protein [Candidatus Sungbacteria bacterium]
MSKRSFEYALQVTLNERTRHDFFELMKGDQKEPSVLYRSVMNMLKKYIEHLRSNTGDRWLQADATYATSLWTWYAAYILAGLYAMYGKTFPRLRPCVFEEMEKACGAPPEILKEIVLKHEALLCDFGEVSKYWIANFRQYTDNDSEFSRTYFCVHGIASIYALGAALIAAAEDTHEDASLSEAGRRDISDRYRTHGISAGLKTELERILEEAKF